MDVDGKATGGVGDGRGKVRLLGDGNREGGVRGGGGGGGGGAGVLV